MPRPTLAAGTAALLITGASLLGTAGVASAQQSPGLGGQNCENVRNVYPQGGNRGRGAGVSDGEVNRGERVRGNSGCSQFAPGRRITVTAESTPVAVGTTTAGPGGAAVIDFTVPTSLENGRHNLVFTDTDNTSNAVRVAFNVVGGPGVAGARQGQGGGQGRGAGQGRALPRTGADQLVPLTIGGVALVGIGASIVVGARRRRETSMPSGLA